jgi:hypothetical protein
MHQRPLSGGRKNSGLRDELKGYRGAAIDDVLMPRDVPVRGRLPDSQLLAAPPNS